jgi:hypothetical protein
MGSTPKRMEVDQWVPAGKVEVNKVLAVHVLSAIPAQINPDVRMVSPRTLASTVTLRNLIMAR